MSVVNLAEFRKKKEQDSKTGPFASAPDLSSGFNEADRQFAAEVAESLIKSSPDCALTRGLKQARETQRVLNANGMHMPRKEFSAEDLDAM